MDSQEDALVAGHSPADDPNWGTEPEQRWGHLLRAGRREPLRSERGAWDLFYPAVARAVRGSRPMPVDPWDAVSTAEVLDAARTAAATARVVAIERRPH
jgi:predicted dehydrogenase